MENIIPLGQVRSIEACGPNRTAKVQNNFRSKLSIFEELRAFASSVPDFRRSSKGNMRHRLDDIIMLMILARAVGCKSRADIIEFGKYNIKRFHKMNMLKNNVPSEATLCRVDNGIDGIAMAERMRKFAEKFHDELTEGCREMEIYCIDGKVLRGVVLENGRSPDIVSAYSYNTGIVMCAEACQEKSNEITAVPKLLDKIDISGKIVTADAICMQKEIIDKIRKKYGYFLIELKANQRSLRYGVEDRLKGHTPVCSITEEPELGHGRIETRTYHMYDGLDIVADKEKWGEGLTIIQYIAETTTKSTGSHASEERLYVSNLKSAFLKFWGAVGAAIFEQILRVEEGAMRAS